ncbi:MAG: glucose-1-phosphate cytidylyltransferase [Flavobacteriaceae bacterium TMED238]|nr:MAG: glucose-1-phosphate cytidylyltransferase [Flavobacteriaceae bacterium TMED238]|tara:strand:+ start:8623 stop:9405 length:783 start_codon:yes stop_codon:yes gene_type:complete
MKVVILAGGYGTRIRDVAEDIPKPMIPIGPYPIILHIMKTYAYFGYKDFVLCLGYKGKDIKDFFLNYEPFTRDFTISFGKEGDLEYHSDHDEKDWKITLADTGLNSMTGSRISKIKKYIDDDIFMLTYGDGVSDINIKKLIDFHKAHGKTLTVTGVRPPGRFGEMVSDESGKITEFNEKPQATEGRISGGYFVANKNLFDYVEDLETLVFEQEPMRNIVNDEEMMVYKHDGFWQPMDTSREYQLLNKLYSDKKAPWIYSP